MLAICSWTVGVIALFMAYKRAHEEDDAEKIRHDREEARHKELLDALKNINKPENTSKKQ